MKDGEEWLQQMDRAGRTYVLLDERLRGGEDVLEPPPHLGPVLLHGTLELCVCVYCVYRMT